jgi:hypothetical protein
VALLRRLTEQEDHISWAVAVADATTGDLLGSVSLHSIRPAYGNAQIGYWTVPAARGRAVAGRAVDAACRRGFAVVTFDRVELYHAVENPTSGRVAEKAGSRLEGRLRRSFPYGDGVRHDELRGPPRACERWGAGGPSSTSLTSASTASRRAKWTPASAGTAQSVVMPSVLTAAAPVDEAPPCHEPHRSRRRHHDQARVAPVPELEETDDEQ